MTKPNSGWRYPVTQDVGSIPKLIFKVVKEHYRPQKTDMHCGHTTPYLGPHYKANRADSCQMLNRCRNSSLTFNEPPVLTAVFT